MDKLYIEKKHMLIKKTWIWIFIILLMLISMIIMNTNDGKIINFIEVLNNTLEKDLLFIPLGLFIICNSFDYRDVYIIRFQNNSNWLKKEVSFLIVVLFCYAIFYNLLAVITNIITIISLKESIEINVILIGVLGLLLIKRFLFLLLEASIILLLNLIFKKNVYLIGFFVYIMLEIVQILEMVVFSSIPIIRPIADINISLLGNLIYMLPLVCLTVFIWIFIFYIMTGDKHEI
ncbi:hypothetical protein [Hathewaya massiliensis]|uniref:hypothetical protein n=1 Tax=Hathewaya massiliensis TaxID=1964382 RepID=UPI001157F970|nr:hypothetical protein [Hathewaya massiliensis]